MIQDWRGVSLPTAQDFQIALEEIFRKKTWGSLIKNAKAKNK